MKHILIGGLLYLATTQLFAQSHSQWSNPWPYDSIFFYSNENIGNPLDSLLILTQTDKLDAQDRLLSRTVHNPTVSRIDTLEYEQFGYDAFGNKSFYRFHSYNSFEPTIEWTKVFDSLGVEKRFELSYIYDIDKEGSRVLVLNEALLETVYSFGMTSTGQWDSTWKSVNILDDRGNIISQDNYQYDSTSQEFILISRSNSYWDNLGNQVGYRRDNIAQGVVTPIDSIAQQYDHATNTSRKSYTWDVTNSTWTLVEHLVNQVIEGNKRREILEFEKVGEELIPTYKVIEEDSADAQIKRLYSWENNCSCWSPNGDFYTYIDEYGREYKMMNDNYTFGKKSSRIIKEYQYIGTTPILHYSSSVFISYNGSLEVRSKSSTVYKLKEGLFPENPQIGNKLFTIFPNPGKGKFVFQNRTQEPGVVEIIDLQGRVLHTVNISDPISTIELNGLPSGYYLVRFTQGDFVEIEKYLFQ